MAPRSCVRHSARAGRIANGFRGSRAGCRLPRVRGRDERMRKAIKVAIAVFLIAAFLGASVFVLTAGPSGRDSLRRTRFAAAAASLSTGASGASVPSFPPFGRGDSRWRDTGRRRCSPARSRTAGRSSRSARRSPPGGGGDRRRAGRAGQDAAGCRRPRIPPVLGARVDHLPADVRGEVRRGGRVDRAGDAGEPGAPPSCGPTSRHCWA